MKEFMKGSKTLLGISIVMVLTAACAGGVAEQTQTVTPPASATSPSPSPTATPAALEEPQVTTPAVALSPSSGPPGMEITVSATGLPADTDVALGLGPEGDDAVVQTTARADGDGRVSATMAIPASAEAGETWVVAVSVEEGEVSGISNGFDVSESPYEPRVSIAPESGNPGTSVEIQAEGFPPGEAVEIGLGREASEYDVADVVQVDDGGSVRTEVSVPSYAEVGERWVVVVTTEDRAVEAVSNVFRVEEVAYDPTVEVVPERVSPGDRVEVTGRGFPAHADVEIGIGRVASEYDVVSTARTDASGRVSTQMVIPSFVDPADEWVVAVAAIRSRVKAISDPLDVRAGATPTPGAALFERTNVFLIAVGDAGQSGKEIGCNDSVVPVEVAIEPTVAPLTAALSRLLDLDARQFEERRLYNALQASDLEVDSVIIRDGEAIIGLTGVLRMGGVCDEPRVRAQLRETALQYDTVDEVSIFINGQPLDDLLGEGPGGTPPAGNLFRRTNIFFIAVGDEGQLGEEIGCGDSVVPVEVSIEPTIAPLGAALRKLLAVGTREYGMSGFYNALYRSQLTLEEVTIEDGEAMIWLSGTLELGGVCDAPRVQAQLEKTALQYETVDEVSVFVNERPLEELLEGSG